MSGQRLSVVVADPSDAGERADVVVGRRLVGVSRRAARAMGLDGRMSIDGKRADPSTRVQLGMRLELRWPVESADDPRLQVLRVTDEFLYVDKPSGVHTHRLRPDDPVALADLVAGTHGECAAASPDPREGGAIHRLDRSTSGVVAFARTRAAWQSAREGLDRGLADKVYAALCSEPVRWPPRAPAGASSSWLSPAPDAPPDPALPAAPGTSTWLVRAPLGHGRRRDRVAVRTDGREAATWIWQVSGALFGMRLATGSRHQARVHMAWLGLPIVGDDRYGPNPAASSDRLLLHAHMLDLSRACPGEQPVRGPWPEALLVACRRRGISHPPPLP